MATRKQPVLPAGAHEAEADSELPEALTGWHAFLLRKAAQRITDLAQEALGPFNLTLRHFGVLSLVDHQSGQSQRMVGERLRIDRTSIVAITDDLEGAGLLERRRGQDRRTYALYLTATGAGQVRQLGRLVTAIHDDFLAPLTGEERQVLRALLRRLV